MTAPALQLVAPDAGMHSGPPCFCLPAALWRAPTAGCTPCPGHRWLCSQRGRQDAAEDGAHLLPQPPPHRQADQRAQLVGQPAPPACFMPAAQVVRPAAASATPGAACCAPPALLCRGPLCPHPHRKPGHKRCLAVSACPCMAWLLHGGASARYCPDRPRTLPLPLQCYRLLCAGATSRWWRPPSARPLCRVTPTLAACALCCAWRTR